MSALTRFDLRAPLFYVLAIWRMRFGLDNLAGASEIGSMQTKRSKRADLAATQTGDHAYRGYLVRVQNGWNAVWFVEKGGTLICWAASPVEAYAQIDGLLG